MKKTITVWLDESLKKRVKVFAVKHDMTITDVAAMALTELLERSGG